MVASLFQMLVGFTGLIGFLLRFIGPLTIAPTITLVGVALFKVGAEHAGKYDYLLVANASECETDY